MRILIADKMPDAGRRGLEALGAVLTYEPSLSADDLPEAIGAHEVLVVRSTKVPAPVFQRGKNLQLVIRAGAGTNTIAVEAASASGVYVANCPGKNAVAVAELVFALLLAVDRRIPAAAAELRRGAWNKKEYGKADGLLGKTLGVIGAGTIATEVIRRARAFGLEIVCWSRSLDERRASALGVRRAGDVLELARASDLVSVHLAYAPETKGLLGASFFGALPKGAVVINTSRGGIVDEAALLAAMESRGVRYGADVFDGEPSAGTADFAHPLAAHPNSVCTPHIGASTEQAEAAVADEVVHIVASYRTKGVVPNCVNLCAQSPGRWQLSVRHLDRVGVLATVLGQIREAGINVEEVQNVIFAGAKAACATIKLDSEPSAELVRAIAGAEHVLGVQVAS